MTQVRHPQVTDGPESSSGLQVSEGAIDSCVHHQWSSPEDLVEYLDPGWREWIGHPRSLPGGYGMRPFVPQSRANPRGDYLANGLRAASPQQLRSDWVGPMRARRALLVHDRVMMSAALPNPHLAREIMRAANDWTISRWLSGDKQLFGVVLVASQVPEEAAAEIRRVGGHPQMAGVLLAASTLGKLFGHPVYRPIYEAAAELELPIVLHRGGDGVPEALTLPTAGAHATSFAEESVLQADPLMSHITSFISNGIFTQFPKLRVLLVGGGIAWIPGLLQRLDLAWRAKRFELPWVTEDPRETFYGRVRVSSYGLETSEILRRLIRTFPEFADLVCYGSGFPAWDTLTVEDTMKLFPENWHQRILHDNADRWLRW